MSFFFRAKKLPADLIKSLVNYVLVIADESAEEKALKKVHVPLFLPRPRPRATGFAFLVVACLV